MTNSIYENKVSYHFPTSIRFGAKVIEEMAGDLKTLGFSAPLIVTDPFLKELPFFHKIIEGLKNEGLSTSLHYEIKRNPVKSDVHRGKEIYLSNNCDCIIGLGGGASMDVARSVALLANHEGDLFRYEEAVGGDQLITNSIPYFVTVPTTSGTGSEVGRSAVISDDETKQKKILFHPNLMAKKVYADPTLTKNLPSNVTAATGLDALTHNIEAYLSKGFHPMCDGIALEGIRLVFDSIYGAYKEPNLANRSKMMMAALMGAVAFQKGLGVVHSTAHALSTKFDLHHGLANAIMLPYGIEYNERYAADKIETICRVIGLEDTTAQGLKACLIDLNKSLNLPTTLSEQKIDKGSVDHLARLAFEDACHQCNPGPVSLEDFKEIYKRAL